MAGFDAPYVPGWDCHGLPIEIKVDEQLGRKKLEMPAVSVRRACREYARKYVDLQRSQFERIGVFGRWNNPYLTMSFEYEAAILRDLLRVLRAGLCLQGLEAGLLVHLRPDRAGGSGSGVRAARFTLGLRALSDAVGRRRYFAGKLAGREVYAIIWTTTPWTIPASQAIAFSPEMEYVALDAGDAVYLVASALREEVTKRCIPGSRRRAAGKIQRRTHGQGRIQASVSRARGVGCDCGLRDRRPGHGRGAHGAGTWRGRLLYG